MPAPTVILDKINGAKASRHIIAGYAIDRIAVVTDFDWSDMDVDVDNLDTGILITTAMNALIAKVGERGSPCPNIPVPTFLEQFIPTVVSSDIVEFRIVYKGYPSLQYQFSTASNEVQTNLDINGTVILVSYDYPKTYQYDSKVAGKTVDQGGMATRQLNDIVFTIKLMATSGLESITELCLLQGGVNLLAWPIGTIVGAPRTWLCASCCADSKDGGTTYEVTATFQYRKAGWDPVVYFIDPHQGLPPADLVPGTGYKVVQIQPGVVMPTFTWGGN